MPRIELDERDCIDMTPLPKYFFEKRETRRFSLSILGASSVLYVLAEVVTHYQIALSKYDIYYFWVHASQLFL